jgi:hypothetical protein
MIGPVYDFLLFVHVLSAFFLLAMVVMYTSFVYGGPQPGRSITIAQALDGIGGAGTLIFGVWLALYIDGYALWDFWILAAIVLWALAAGTGQKAHAGLVGAKPSGDEVAMSREDVIRWHLIRTGLIVVLLADMIFKPGA